MTLPETAGRWFDSTRRLQKYPRRCKLLAVYDTAALSPQFSQWSRGVRSCLRVALPLTFFGPIGLSWQVTCNLLTSG